MMITVPPRPVTLMFGLGGASMRWSLVIVIACTVVGCSGSVERDDRPAFTVDPGQPFRLEFGRGSGWHGLNTVKLDTPAGSSSTG